MVRGERMQQAGQPSRKKPEWLRRRLPSGPGFEEVRRLVAGSGLHTVCQEAACPNMWECFSSKTATFMIMGSRCTRNCLFCAVKSGPVFRPDPEEPKRVAKAAANLGLHYVVITSVTRDDLEDGGASCFVDTIREIRKMLPAARVETLIPDFQGDKAALQIVAEARPDVLNHNIETVSRLYKAVRPQAVYQRSLYLFRDWLALAPDIPAKSGLMLGLGETEEEIEAVLKDLFSVGCRILTMGQYLQPSKEHLPVKRYVPPEEFEIWRERAYSIGFHKAVCGPLVRSSYKARNLYD